MENNDDELMRIFLEEAHDLTEEINQQIRIWQAGPPNPEILVPILHALHTLKGSARMLNFFALGEYVHGLEQIVQIIDTEQLILKNFKLTDLLIFFDALNEYLERFMRSQVLPKKNLPLEQLKKLLNQLKPAIENSRHYQNDEGKQQNTSSLKKIDSIASIRIKVARLDSFYKLAAQINISRSHLEQQIIELRKLTAVIGKELDQLQEQLRYLLVVSDKEVKTYGETQNELEGFDIIEFEHFSSWQHANCDIENKIKIMESLNASCSKVVRNAEATLVEQKRVAQALEAEIIHVRLVSTDQLAHRLARIVRQVSRELGKEVNFECSELQGEVDRKILETLTFPLEHLIRNAIDHGIELPAVRKNQGKPEHGLISLAIYKQGGEMVIQLADNGQGIDIDKVRQRAIDKGLWHIDDKMSLSDAVQIIPLPGFSTNEEITPISGRGVGLDVVMAAINKLGGTLQIESEKHLGTQFTIRLPFTLSLNRALIFTINKQFYAVLLSNLVGLTRKSFAQIMHKVNYTHSQVEYLQEQYIISFLSEILGEGTRADYQEQQSLLPIIFLKYNDKRVALVVDNVIGSQEIIVKPTGIQLQFVREIAGVSLLNDNQVVLILNSFFIIQTAVKQQKLPQSMVVKQRKQQARVLIVDDSATVRQVMNRLLQRHGYEVQVAKDGLEALNMMAATLPDMLLLDIEMPRMNGLKLLEKMRSELNYQTIPIIIITSRSGEKHRLKAKKIGATYYLNKPFKQKELISLLKHLQKKHSENGK